MEQSRKLLRFDFVRLDLGYPGIQPLRADENAPADAQDGQGRQSRHFAVDDVMQMRLGAAQFTRGLGHRQYAGSIVCRHIAYFARILAHSPPHKQRAGVA